MHIKQFSTFVGKNAKRDLKTLELPAIEKATPKRKKVTQEVLAKNLFVQILKRSLGPCATKNVTVVTKVWERLAFNLALQDIRPFLIFVKKVSSAGKKEKSTPEDVEVFQLHVHKEKRKIRPFVIRAVKKDMSPKALSALKNVHLIQKT